MNEFIETNYNLNDKELVSVIDELSLWAAPFGLKLLEKIPIKKNITVLDIGFGLGFPLLEVAMRLGNSCKVIGIDPWETAINRAKAKAKIYEIRNAQFINGKAEEIPLPDDSVDLIISNNGINNVENLNKTFGECGRVAKPGAQMVFTLNLEKTMIEFYEVFEKVLTNNKMNDEIINLKNHIYKKRKPIDEIIKIANEKCLDIDNIVEDKFYYRFSDGTTMMNHFFIKLAFLDSWKIIVPTNMQKTIFDEIEIQLNNIAANKGEIVLTIPFVTCSFIRR